MLNTPVSPDALPSPSGTFLALALIGLSLSGRRSRLLPAWHATLGFVAAVLQFSSATLTPLVMDHGGLLALLGLIGWLIWTAWLIVYGIALIRLAPSGHHPPVTASD